MSHLSAVPPPPDYPEHNGRRVEWDPWQRIHIMCLPPTECAQCGSTAEAYFAAGVIQPAPGETTQDTRQRPSSRVPGRVWEQRVTVHQWPYYGLAAFACPDCRGVEVYDSREDFAPVDTARPTLF
ncbi:hypothetical protein F4561_002693 [Lipingzhangella halophila]|uniref:Uncharacterized protein n=1 Tax=Lipingzhangella halophila TaxID=1783352 RepID=A0A7W7W2W8_9ACTN|nr:hypothetical protein [Lipingzhangella halophila]MBB4931873.1 hypothetical protein [Lipingzhangella halophila]